MTFYILNGHFIDEIGKNRPEQHALLKSLNYCNDSR